ncbi:tRNA (adenosine(37)-N6)-dimethylallyltransferase MiaA [Patescibacteria group bacterium]
MSPKRRSLIVIAGPTASGKSKMAVDLARTYNGEIISADSRQVYKDTPIATDVISAEEMRGIKHHLLEIVPLDHHFTAAEYQQKANEHIKNIQADKRLPFLVGGTGLYIRSIVEGYSLAGGVIDEKLRKKLQKKPLDKLVKMLEKKDPDAAASIDIANHRRVMRALEVVINSNKPLQTQQKTNPPDYPILQLAIDFPRPELYQRINQRVDEQVEKGLERELRALYDKYGYERLFELGLCYRQFARHFKGEIDRTQAIGLTKRDTRRLAKRQLTWLRSDPKIKWIRTRRDAAYLIRAFLEKYRIQ